MPGLPGAVGQTGSRKGQIAGVALTTQRSTVINVDRKGGALKPVDLRKIRTHLLKV